MSRQPSTASRWAGLMAGPGIDGAGGRGCVGTRSGQPGIPRAAREVPSWLSTPEPSIEPKKDLKSNRYILISNIWWVISSLLLATAN